MTTARFIGMAISGASVGSGLYYYNPHFEYGRLIVAALIIIVGNSIGYAIAYHRNESAAV